MKRISCYSFCYFH